MRGAEWDWIPPSDEDDGHDQKGGLYLKSANWKATDILQRTLNELIDHLGFANRTEYLDTLKAEGVDFLKRFK